MSKNSSRPVGRHFLHIPGPTQLPDRVLRAMDTPIIDHRGPEFAKLTKKCLEGIKTIFKTARPIIMYTATGTGAWEAALVNTLSPGDRVLMVETGQFATLWKVMAEKLGLGNRPRHDDAERHDLVVRRIGRVAAAGKAVEGDIAGNLGLEPAFQSRRQRGGHNSSIPDVKWARARAD